jgi:hypothetical protein
MAGRARRRRLPPWLPAAGVFVGVALLATRLATLPFAEFGPFLVGLIVAVALTVAIFAGLAITRSRRMRAAVSAFPQSLLIPIVTGTDTAAATRWLAEHVGDARLRLRAEQAALVVVDSSGLRVLGGSEASAPLPAGELMILPLTTARVGARRVDALVVGVTVGDAVVPLPLVPVRSSVFALGTLRDAELLDVSARIRDALAGDAVTPGWDY